MIEIFIVSVISPAVSVVAELRELRNPQIDSPRSALRISRMVFIRCSPLDTPGFTVEDPLWSLPRRGLSISGRQKGG